jgi:hypothetical protein
VEEPVAAPEVIPTPVEPPKEVETPVAELAVPEVEPALTPALPEEEPVVPPPPPEAPMEEETLDEEAMPAASRALLEELRAIEAGEE